VGVWPRRIVALVGVIALGVISNYAYAALQDSTLPFGNLVAVLIWPFAMLCVAAITIAVVLGERPPTPSSVESVGQERESPEVAASRARLAEIDAREAKQRTLDALQGLMADGYRLLSDLESPGPANEPVYAPQIDQWIRRAEVFVGMNWPADLRAFEQPARVRVAGEPPWWVTQGHEIKSRLGHLRMIAKRDVAFDSTKGLHHWPYDRE